MSEPPTIPILLLGDANVGKSTFLARLAHGPSSIPSSQPLNPTTPVILELRKPSCRLEFSTLSTWPSLPSSSATALEDTDDTATFTVDGAAAAAASRPAVIILCYSVSSRRSLMHVRAGWSKLVARELNWDEGAPTMLLGLGRDLRGWDGRTRVEGDVENGEEGQDEEEAEDSWVLPQEGLVVAQELRCDRYAECSAVSGELVQEVWEDVVKMAVGTLQGWGGGRSTGPTCCAM